MQDYKLESRGKLQLPSATVIPVINLKKIIKKLLITENLKNIKKKTRLGGDRGGNYRRQ